MKSIEARKEALRKQIHPTVLVTLTYSDGTTRTMKSHDAMMLVLNQSAGGYDGVHIVGADDPAGDDFLVALLDDSGKGAWADDVDEPAV